MAEEISTTRTALTEVLERKLENAVSVITKNYLSELEDYELIRPSFEDTDIDAAECGRFFRLTRLALNQEENFLDKLTTIVNVASAIGSSLATIIRSDGGSIAYYIGILSKNHRQENEKERRKREADAKAFEGALSGNLQGSELLSLSEAEMRGLTEAIFKRKENCYAAISSVVSMRDKENKQIEAYVQGIENLVDSLKGLSYTILMLADPVGTGEIQTVKQGYETLYTELATFFKQSMTFQETDTWSLSASQTKGISEGLSKGVSMTQSTTVSKGKYLGGTIGGGLGLGILSVHAGISKGSNWGNAQTSGRTDTKTETKQYTQTSSKAASASQAEGKSLQIHYENRSVRALLEQIDQNLERLDQCESFGAFTCAAYVVAEDRETALTVASNYNALMRGRESHVQSSHINTWYEQAETKEIGRYLKAFVHPRFFRGKERGADRVIVTPASLVSGNELAIQIGLPKKSINGVTVIPMAPFGRNIRTLEKREGLLLGHLYHMGREEGSEGCRQEVRLDIQSLASHLFLTGSTGSGKTTAIYAILERLRAHRIKFLVIEPAKGEYKHRFGNDPDVRVYGTNQRKTPLLRLDPFRFPEDVHVLEHIDRLIEIFNVCWPMYAAMPAVLKDALERAYQAAGWDLDSSECSYQDRDGKPVCPNFSDVLKQIHQVIDESQYSVESKGDYKGALCTRVKSLTNGLYGQMFTGAEIPAEELFEENVIVDLSRTGSVETKALLMGILVMKLQEYHMSRAAGSNLPLRHVTVLEEAHHLLKSVSGEQTMESANLLGKSVEMLAASIAEMRTYGEGFLIADQAPLLLDRSVIRNTNTKVILRLPDLADRELVGYAAGLNKGQVTELSKLENLVAAVYQNNWLEPVLCKLDVETAWGKSGSVSREYTYKPPEEESSMFAKKRTYIHYLLQFLEERRQLDPEVVRAFQDGIWKLPIPVEGKKAFLDFMEADTRESVRRLCAKAMQAMFDPETVAYLLKKQDIETMVWYQELCERLGLEQEGFSETERCQIAMILVYGGFDGRGQTEKRLQDLESMAAELMEH